MKRWAIVLLAVHGTALANEGESLGRLFFTPDQRQMLDRERRLLRDRETESRIRLDGVASHGKTVSVWLNGTRQDGGLPADASTLRVGESLNSVTGDKKDLVPYGSVAPSRNR